MIAVHVIKYAKKMTNSPDDRVIFTILRIEVNVKVIVIRHGEFLPMFVGWCVLRFFPGTQQCLINIFSVFVTVRSLSLFRYLKID